MTTAAKPRQAGLGNKGGAAGIAPYDHVAVERRAKSRWEDHGCFVANDGGDRPKFFCGTNFTTLAGPIHLGHCRNHVVCDVMARMQRMRGHEVLQSVGWEGCGLRVRMAAEDAGTSPGEWAARARENGRDVLRRLGLAVDWSREVSTEEPELQRLEQQLFLRLWQADPSFVKQDKQPGIAYWDAGTKSFVSPRQLVNGRGPESGMLAEIREVDTYEVDVAAATARQLLDGLEKLPRWDAFVKSMQRESIGQEEGLTIPFEIHGPGGRRHKPLTVFTSRPDTLMGTTYLAVGVNHELAGLVAATEDGVREFCDQVNNPRYAYRKLGEDKRQEGMPLGIYAVNPINGDHVPVWVTNYVVAGYGTGATLGVPAHDQRNFNFAVRHNLPLRRVAVEDLSQLETPLAAPYVSRGGIVVNSAGLEQPLNALVKELKAKDGGGDSLLRKRNWNRAVNDCVLGFLHEQGVKAKRATVSRLRGWKVSQDEYWGCPVPLVHCPSCGTVPVPEEDLPVRLPEHEPGKDSLADHPSFVVCKCPECGAKAKRDTDTLAELFNASWNFTRHGCASKDGALDDKAAAWLPVDFYCCGVENATTHLLCSRIMHRCMDSLGMLPGRPGPEPFSSLMSLGPVLNYGLPMASWYGNAIEPGDLLDECGADLLRLLLATNVDPRHPLHWDDAKLFALQGVVTPAELGLYRDGRLSGVKADLLDRALSEGERKRLGSGLLDKDGFAKLRAGTLDENSMRKARKTLDERDIRRLRHGVLDEAGLRSLRKGTLPSDKMAQVRKVLTEAEVLRLQRGLLDRQQLSLLCAGKLPEKARAKARALVGDKVLDELAALVQDPGEVGAIARAQEKLLDPIEQESLAREKSGLDLLRKVRGILSDGQLARLRNGLLDEKGFASLRAGKLKGERLKKAVAIAGKEGIARLRQGLLDREAMARLYTGELSAKEKKAVEKITGPDVMAKLDKAALPREKFEKLVRTLGGMERLERLRKGALGAEKTKKAEKVIGKRNLASFQAASLDDAVYERLASFVDTATMDRLVSFVDARTQARLDKALGKEEKRRLLDDSLFHRARPLLRVLDEGRMDDLLDFTGEEKMDALVNFLEPDTMEKILGFTGHFWDVVATKASLVAASAGKRTADPRRARLHRCLKAIDAAYLKKSGGQEQSKHGIRDLELGKVLARVREMVALLDSAKSVDSKEDCEFARECSAILLCVVHPIMPHITEELWSALGFGGLLCDAPWPKVDDRAFTLRDADTYVVQVNGRKKLSFFAAGSLKQGQAEKKALAELGRHDFERGHPGFPGTGEEVVGVEWAMGDAEHVVNFVTYKNR